MDDDELRALAEKAARAASGARGYTNLQVGPPKPLSIEEFLALGDEPEPPREGHELVITLPGPFDPLERVERFELPLAQALGELGEVVGGGTLVHGSTPAESDVQLLVQDVAASLPVIRQALAAQGAPAGTTITVLGPEREVLPL